MTRLGDFFTLGNFLKPLATINLLKSPTFLGNFCKAVKIYNFSIEIVLGNFYRHLAIFSGHTASIFICHFDFSFSSFDLSLCSVPLFTFYFVAEKSFCVDGIKPSGGNPSILRPFSRNFSVVLDSRVVKLFLRLAT